MRILLWIIVMFTGSMLLGCESSEQPEAQTPSAVQQPVKTELATKTEDVKVDVAAIDAAQPAADQTEKRVEQTDKPAEAVMAETEKALAPTVEKAAKTAENTMAKQVQQSAAEVVTTKQTNIPREIILEASYGNITFPHALHAGNYACKVCHGDATPADFDITKDVAHKLCKDCHKKEGVGPTACSGCHKK